MSQYLQAFTDEEMQRAKLLLASQVVKMMGRKFEEGDWSSIYCGAKGIPERGWSNLNIDIMHEGLGVEHKMLCVYVKPGGSLKEVCGTSLMHPAATRSIRVESTHVHPEEAMREIFRQHKELIESRESMVRQNSQNNSADMRTGWLIWERSLTEFLYFEEKMFIPDPEFYYAEWNERLAGGTRKSSKNLWIYEKLTGKKRYSVTTKAGVKIQPYFDVPAPTSPELYYFKVQGEEITPDKIIIWISPATAKELFEVVGNLEPDFVSRLIIKAASSYELHENQSGYNDSMAFSLLISKEAYEHLVKTWQGVSDEHRVRLLIQTFKTP
ncbi:MAG: hypothetical protein H0T73_03960 [Ardenticatenales bacterium]|nr:hypothetical protein [Ardenticatenales bacterium]